MMNGMPGAGAGAGGGTSAPSGNVWMNVLQAILGPALSGKLGIGKDNTTLDQMKGRTNDELNKSTGERPEPGKFPGGAPATDMSMRPGGVEDRFGGHAPGTNPQMLLMMAKGMGPTGRKGGSENFAKYRAGRGAKGA